MKYTRTLSGDLEKLNTALLATLERVPAWAWLVILVPLWIIAFAVNIGY